MASSFLFYDLETSGINPKQSRVMQFGAQRTDMDLQPIGEPINVFIKLTPDVLPDPDAIMITGITPQETLADGLTEVEFLKLFYGEVVTPDTIFVGFNNVRFDDEFICYLNYRNFYDAYEWRWMNACSRWDLLDFVRMTRALRPDGIQWPVNSDGKPTNRLELLSKLNNLEHETAHDALSDVYATINIAKLIKTKQPDLFNYLVNVRDKKAVTKLVESDQPFIYTSGRYPSETLHTTAAVRLAKHPQEGSVLVYDLRYDPKPFINMSVEEIVDSWRYSRDKGKVRLPVKTMKYNRCPAVAPMGVIKDEATQQRLGLDLKTVANNLSALQTVKAALAEKILRALRIMDDEREQVQAEMVDNPLSVDGRFGAPGAGADRLRCSRDGGGRRHDSA